MGTVPAGFTDPGTDYSFTGSVAKIQTGSPPVDATAAAVSPLDHTLANPGEADSGTVNIEGVAPTNGRWNVSTAATALIQLDTSTGTGNGSFNWSYNGRGTTRDIEIIVRSGHTVGSGTQLATFTITL